MSGEFNLNFWHGVPAVDSWQALFKTQNIVRKLPQHEVDEANRVINGGEMNERFNVTVRWHESRYDGCPYLCGTAAQIAVPQAPARTIQCLPGSAPVRKMPEMATVNKIVGPAAPSPPPPPPVAKSDAAMESKPSSSSSAVETHRVDTEQAVETHRVDTEQAVVTNTALFRLYTDITLAVPD